MKWESTYLAPLVVLLTFIFNQLLSAYLRKGEIRRNWYMKVFIEPNNDTVDNFFRQIHEILITASEQLSQSLDKKNLVMKYTRDFQMEKEKFEYTLLNPIEISFRFKSHNMPSRFIMDIEDDFANCLAEISDMKTQIEINDRKLLYSNSISAKRSQLMKSIYYPLTDYDAFSS